MSTSSQLRGSNIFADDSIEQFPLPPRQVIGPDSNGIKKVIEYKFNENGHKVTVTSTFRVRTLKTFLSKRVAERRSWTKFGDATNEDVNSRLTTVSAEEVFLERPFKGSEAEEYKTWGYSPTQLGKKGVFMIRRTSGRRGDHWTPECPYKDFTPQKTVPTSMLSSTDKKHRDDGNSIKVCSLSEGTSESDLRELFCPFGPLSRVFVRIDHQNGLCRGFGYVTFVNKEDAQRAIDKLHRCEYDNQILQVGWANQDET